MLFFSACWLRCWSGNKPWTMLCLRCFPKRLLMNSLKLSSTTKLRRWRRLLKWRKSKLRFRISHIAIADLKNTQAEIYKLDFVWTWRYWYCWTIWWCFKIWFKHILMDYFLRWKKSLLGLYATNVCWYIYLNYMNNC